MKRVLNSVITVAISFCLVAVFSLGSVAKAETIKVGAILAVTGPASFLGGPEARTLEMMVEEINAKGLGCARNKEYGSEDWSYARRPTRRKSQAYEE